MSRILKLFSCLVILLLVGCSKDKYIYCDIKIDNDTQSYEMTGTYKIYYNNNYVTKIEKKEKYISSDSAVLKYLEEVNSLDYYNLNDLYGGFFYTIDSNKDNIQVDAVIDFDLLDVRKMVKNKILDKDYVISDQLTTSGIVKIYESKGAVCDI